MCLLACFQEVACICKVWYKNIPQIIVFCVFWWLFGSSLGGLWGGLWRSLGGLWGLLGALGAILAHLGPKSQHNTKNHRSLEPSWGPSWAYVEEVSLKRRFKTPLENMLLPNIIFSTKLGVPEPLLDTKNRAKPLERCQKIMFSAFHQKLIWGRVLGPLLEGFLSPSWGQVGTSWVHVGT